MARTKQTARRSTGGKAPRKQLATKAARCPSVAFRNYMSSGQRFGVSASSCEKKKTSFINYENTFGTFQFDVPIERMRRFKPHLETGLDNEGSAYVSLSICSDVNGSGMSKDKRPKLNLVFVLDISGSMGWSFDNDDDDDDVKSISPFRSNRSTKLDSAKRCLNAYLAQLTPEDRIGIVLFNHEQRILQPLQLVSKINTKKLEKMLSDVYPSGGTKLSQGFSTGLDMIEDHLNSCGNDTHSSRVIFLTDMESDDSDEASVVKQAQTFQKKKNIYSTVVGIGVDLSVGTIEKLSSIPGSQYVSVSNSAEFEQNVKKEFAYDMTIIARDIKLKCMTPSLSFTKAFGSAELHGVRRGRREVKLSSEFASMMEDEQTTNSSSSSSIWNSLTNFWTSSSSKESVGKVRGGIFLFKMSRHVPDAKFTVSWKDDAGRRHEENLDVKFPEQGCDSVNIRKALALIRYVDLQSSYVLDDANDGDEEHIMSVTKLRDCAASHARWIEQFKKLKSFVNHEITKTCDDDTLKSSNRAVLDTIEQIIEIESKTLENTRKLVEMRVKALSNPSKVTRSHVGPQNEFLCPITGEVMKDPVICEDGFSYERAAIEKWFQTGSQKSPMTNKTLSSTKLISNHSLRKIIEDWKVKEKKKNDDCMSSLVRGNVSLKRKRRPVGVRVSNQKRRRIPTNQKRKRVPVKRK